MNNTTASITVVEVKVGKSVLFAANINGRRLRQKQGEASLTCQGMALHFTSAESAESAAQDFVAS
jgi:hypothetical protein